MIKIEKRYVALKELFTYIEEYERIYLQCNIAGRVGITVEVTKKALLESLNLVFYSNDDLFLILFVPGEPHLKIAAENYFDPF